jgi:hypothetical protein
MRDRSQFQSAAHIRTKYRDIRRPDKGLAGTREFGLKIGTFPQKPGRMATLPLVRIESESDILLKFGIGLYIR